MLNEFADKLKQREITVKIDKSIIEYIVKVGFDDVYGARPLKRAVQSKVEDKFAEELLDGKIKDKDKITLKAKDNNVIIEVK